MGKSGTNRYWATLSPVFSPQKKELPVGPDNPPDPDGWNEQGFGRKNPLLLYMQHEHKIDFSTSVLDAMNAQAPVAKIHSLLKSSIWDGPKIFRDYVLENIPLQVAPKKLTSVKPSAIHIANDVKEQMQNQFLINCGLYIEDPTFLTKTKSNPIIPNPDFDLAITMLSCEIPNLGAGWDQDALDAFIEIVGEEFYKLLLSENYGFSTTLIFPNLDIVDDLDTVDQAIKEKIAEKEAKKAYEDWLKKMKKRKPGGPKDPWDPSPPDPYKTPWDPDPYPHPKPRPNPYTYPPDDDWDPKPYDYQKYKEWVQRKRDWDKSNAASSASQVHNK